MYIRKKPFASEKYVARQAKSKAETEVIDGVSKEKAKKSPFGAYDIRGIYGDNLTEEFAFALGSALAKHIGYGKLIAVGHDSRKSSPSLSQALIAGIEDNGCQTFFLGLASTPRVYWHGAKPQFAASVAVTASHLPARHNGFKLCRHEAIPISSEDGLKDLQLLMQANNFELKGALTKQALVTGQTTSVASNELAKYVDALGRYLSPGRKLKFVVDVGGSPVGEELQKLFANRDLDVTVLNSQPDGTFSRRSANPMDDGALDELCSKITEGNADFGAAFDGDGDRVVFVDEKGVIVPPDLVTGLLAKQIIEKIPGAKIMYDLRSSRAVPEYIASAGGQPLKCRVGHSFIKADMRKFGIELAGEMSSHYYWADMACTDNAVRALIEIINQLSAGTKTLSELVFPLSKYATSGEINFECNNPQTSINFLKNHYSNVTPDMTDGLTMELTGWWFNVRGSHTEPLLRLCLGAENSRELMRRRLELEQLIVQTLEDAN